MAFPAVEATYVYQLDRPLTTEEQFDAGRAAFLNGKGVQQFVSAANFLPELV